jgi:hypothetical protein
MSAGRVDMSQGIMSATIYASPVLKDFVIPPPIRPEYFITNDENKMLPVIEGRNLSPRLYVQNIALLNAYYEALLSRDNEAQECSFTQQPYWSPLDQKYASEIVSRDVIGFSSNEVGVDLAKICASLQRDIDQSDRIQVITASTVETITTTKDKYIVLCSNTDGERFIIEAESIVNAAWESAPLLDRGALQSYGASETINLRTPTNDNYCYRIQLYGFVRGISSEGPGTYRSILSKDGAHYYQITEDTAVIEVEGYSNFDQALSQRPGWWNELLDKQFTPSEVGHYVTPLLNACRRQYKGIFDTAHVDNALFGAFWVEGSDRGRVGTKAYRGASTGLAISKYFPYAAEKLPICIKSSINTALHLYAQSVNSAQRREIMQMMQYEESITLRNMLLALPGMKLNAIRDEDVLSARHDESSIRTVESYSLEKFV